MKLYRDSEHAMILSGLDFNEASYVVTALGMRKLIVGTSYRKEAVDHVFALAVSKGVSYDRMCDFVHKASAFYATGVESPSGPACTCPSGDGSLRWPCPVHPPEAEPVSAPASGGDSPTVQQLTFTTDLVNFEVMNEGLAHIEGLVKEMTAKLDGCRSPSEVPLGWVLEKLSVIGCSLYAVKMKHAVDFAEALVKSTEVAK